MKKKTISFDDFAKKVSVNPEKYKSDTIELAARIKVYLMLYGDLGFKGLQDFLLVLTKE